MVSIPTLKFKGVVQYNYGKIIRGGYFKHIGTLNKPPLLLLIVVAKLQADHELIRS
jgi:hypothetical protein